MSNGCKIEATQRIYTEGTGVKPLGKDELYDINPSFPIINECGLVEFKPTMKGCIVPNGAGGLLYGNVVNFKENANTECPLDTGIAFFMLIMVVGWFSVKNFIIK